MNLEIRSRGLELSSRLAIHIERRVRFGLARFGHRVRRVHVALTDVNGPRGGEDIECKIRADLGPRGELVVHELHDDPFAAVGRATERISHGIARRLQRFRVRRLQGSRRRTGA